MNFWLLMTAVGFAIIVLEARRPDPFVFAAGACLFVGGLVAVLTRLF